MCTRLSRFESGIHIGYDFMLKKPNQHCNLDPALNKRQQIAALMLVPLDSTIPCYLRTGQSKLGIKAGEFVRVVLLKFDLF